MDLFHVSVTTYCLEVVLKARRASQWGGLRQFGHLTWTVSSLKTKRRRSAKTVKLLWDVRLRNGFVII